MWNLDYEKQLIKDKKQAGAELCQAQLKLKFEV